MSLFPPAENPEYLVHRRWMERAIALAQAAGEAGEVPVGAVVVADGKAIAEAENRRERDHDPTAHAEILALRAAGKVLNNWHLNDCTLYVTLEPCPMCAGALILARLGLLVYGTDDPKTGAVRTVINLPDSSCSNHRLAVIGGILEVLCREQLQSWFAQRRHRELGRGSCHQ
ncbi:tRNA adenosine(34) deaminase TadA [Leptothermofonsia sp. ETS-13]|uniref:tRNA adenosine(34) deaminase TadA n=1 Tax=Leptothermofonsia sp. ETS-13 TaxID=3035696 RepID=UPI003B9E5E1C